MCSLILSLEMRVPSIDIYHRIRNPSMDEKVELQHRLRWLSQGSISKVSQSMVDASLELYPIVSLTPRYSPSSTLPACPVPTCFINRNRYWQDLLAPSCFNGRSRGLQRDIRAKKKGLQPQGVASIPENHSSSSNSILGRKARKPKAMIYSCFLPEVDVEKRALMQRDTLIMLLLKRKSEFLYLRLIHPHFYSL
ncbi:hypothetical protein Tco_0368085 [Tanacetum coccineum]